MQRRGEQSSSLRVNTGKLYYYRYLSIKLELHALPLSPLSPARVAREYIQERDGDSHIELEHNIEHGAAMHGMLSRKNASLWRLRFMIVRVFVVARNLTLMVDIVFKIHWKGNHTKPQIITYSYSQHMFCIEIYFDKKTLKTSVDHLNCQRIVMRAFEKPRTNQVFPPVSFPSSSRPLLSHSLTLTLQQMAGKYQQENNEFLFPQFISAPMGDSLLNTMYSLCFRGTQI